MQSRLNGDALYSELPRQIGNYATDEIQSYVRSNVSRDVGSFKSVGHLGGGDVDIESGLKGIEKVLTKKDPAVYADYGLQGNDRGVLKYDELLTMSEAKGTRERRPNNKIEQIDRFEYPISDPQHLQNIVYDEIQRGGMQSRNVAKDAYKITTK
jgi:hypothetical protein